MRTPNIIFLLLIFSLYSCKAKTNQQFEKDIVGEWKYVSTRDNREPKLNDELWQPASLSNRGTNGYIFYQDKSCENKVGYFKRIKGAKWEDGKTIYLGNKTQYKIEDGNLKILDLCDSTWQNQKIFSIVDDTLILQTNDSLFVKYARVHYTLNPNETYDKIIISSSGCFGTCPIMDISIDSNGEILFWGESYNTENGFFSSNITKEKFQNILTTFKKADIQNLNDNYQANWTDDETVTIAFIKDRQIVKSITDYGRQSPVELIWAYTPIRFLYQQIKLAPLKKDKPNLPIWSVNFETGQDIFNLSKAESFYLLTEIYKGKEVSAEIELKYKIQYWSEQDKKETIYTDGQIFKFADKTIDIGYNFLTVNNLQKRFRPKNKYEK